LVGLPEPLITLIQPWRAAIGERLFDLFRIDLNPPGANWEGATFSFSRDVDELLPQAKAWYGPLGLLLFLPTLFFYLVVFPFIKRDIWKWLTALASFLYIAAFIAVLLWQPYIGRMLMIGVALGMPLTAGFYLWTEKYKAVRWAVLALAVTVLGWSATHDYHKPLFGSWTIWNADYYDLRTRHESDREFFHYLDANLPEDARLGLAVTEADNLWEYPFFGPGLTRKVTYLGPLPARVDSQLFAEHNIDYLLLVKDPSDPIDSTAPLWPLGILSEQHWFMVKRSEMELFAAQPRQSNVYYRAFGEDYMAYVKIRELVEKEAATGRVLTTDPRMPYYDLDQRFVFALPNSINDLSGFTFIVTAPEWSPQDYERFGLSADDVSGFLARERFVKKIDEVNGYTMYRILSSKAGQ